MKKVVKFGGSSLASAEQFMKVCDIIRADESRRYVVPSAPGKRFNDDIKVTDMLYRCYELAESGQPFNKQMNQIKDRYNEIIRGLKLDFSLNDDFETIKKQFLAKAGRMYAASRGEYLNGKIMAKYLGFEFIDSRGLFRFFGVIHSLTSNAVWLVGNCSLPCYYPFTSAIVPYFSLFVNMKSTKNHKFVLIFLCFQKIARRRGKRWLLAAGAFFLKRKNQRTLRSKAGALQGEILRITPTLYGIL